MDVAKIVEENPAIVFGVAGVFILMLLLRGGSGASTQSMINAQLQSQKIAGDTDVKLSAINADVAKARTKYATDRYTTTVTTGAQLAGLRDTNQLKLQLGAMDAATKQQGIQAQQTIAAQTITANQQTAYKALDTQTKMLEDSNNLKAFQISQLYANLPQVQAGQQALMVISGQNAQALASINASNSQALASINTEAARTSASASARSSDTTNWLGAIANIGSMFF